MSSCRLAVTSSLTSPHRSSTLHGMSYLPLVIGLAAVTALILYVERWRRLYVADIAARQAITDRRFVSLKEALGRIERRLDAVTTDREVAQVPLRQLISKEITLTFNGAVDAKQVSDVLSVELNKAHDITYASPPCLDCGKDPHIEDCALSMDDLVESPTDAAARRARD